MPIACRAGGLGAVNVARREADSLRHFAPRDHPADRLAGLHRPGLLNDPSPRGPRPTGSQVVREFADEFHHFYHDCNVIRPGITPQVIRPFRATGEMYWRFPCCGWTNRHFHRDDLVDRDHENRRSRRAAGSSLKDVRC